GRLRAQRIERAGGIAREGRYRAHVPADRGPARVGRLASLSQRGSAAALQVGTTHKGRPRAGPDIPIRAGLLRPWLAGLLTRRPVRRSGIPDCASMRRGLRPRMNAVFFSIVLVAFLVAGYFEIGWVPPTADAVSPMAAVGTAMIDSAGGAVTLAIGLVGVMALFLGLMKVAEAGGMLAIIARTLRPLLVRAFPDVPPDHPAMGAMILNLSANAVGLANAATPFGIRAMQELDKLNPVKGTATNAMALFLALNTSSVTLLPTGVIALRASAG